MNTLIDLTGIVAYMGVNQVRGRALRIDKYTPHKVANIYDIVTVYDSYNKDVDFLRLQKKHEQFYGVDDMGLIIKGIHHIYPNLENHYLEFEKINENMLKRSTLRDYYYTLWKIGQKYENKEVFGLDLELKSMKDFFPFVNFRVYDSIPFFSLFGKKQSLKQEIESDFYEELMYRFLKKFLKNIVKTQKTIGILPKEFLYDLQKGSHRNYKLLSSYKDDLIVKRFMLDISTLFKKIGTHKYVIQYPAVFYDGETIKKDFLVFGLPDSLSKNKQIRTAFKEELYNDLFFPSSLLNMGKVVNLGIKAPLILGAGALSAVVTPLVILFPFAAGYIFFKELFWTQQKNRVSLYKRYYKAFLSHERGFRISFVYLDSAKVKKDQFVGKNTCIESKVQKIWM